MPLTNIPDLAFEIDGDLIRLEQSTGCGETTMVEVHRLHIAHLAEQLNIQGGAPARTQSRQERALLRLWHKLDLTAAPCWLDEIVDRVGEGLAYRGYVYDALDTLEGLMEDLGIVIPASVSDDAQEEPRNGNSSNENSDAAISVTQGKRGRPASGQALSNAERQSRHRTRQADLLDTTVAGCGQGDS